MTDDTWHTTDTWHMTDDTWRTTDDTWRTTRACRSQRHELIGEVEAYQLELKELRQAADQARQHYEHTRMVSAHHATWIVGSLQRSTRDRSTSA